MAKHRRRLTPAEKAAKLRRNAEFEIIFINGKQKRVLRRGGVEGLTAEQFVVANADPIWLHQNEMWEHVRFPATGGAEEPVVDDGDDELPF